MGRASRPAWGRPERRPTGTVSTHKSNRLDCPADQQFAIRAKQGTTVPLVEARIVDPEGLELPWDGQSLSLIHIYQPTRPY